MERLQKEEWELNHFNFEEILNESDKGIRLLIRTPDGPKSPWLPKKYISLFRKTKEVLIPEWLCLDRGLIKEIYESTRSSTGSRP